MGGYLRKAKAHQRHCTDFLPRWHLQMPDYYSWIDTEGNICECGKSCNYISSYVLDVDHRPELIPLTVHA